MTSVLIVDDDPAIRMITAIALKRDGWVVEQAESGEQALEMDAASHDLVLVDLMMPDMDGRELLGQLKRRVPDIVAVFITARHDLDQELLALGAAGVLRKPYNPATLGSELRNFLP